MFPVEDSVNKYFLFSRYFFSDRFGGNPVQTFPSIAPAKLAEHGIDDWAFPSVEFNPHAPQVPGAPGLFYAPGVRWKRAAYTKRVIVRLNAGKWLYVGSYKFNPADPLTVEEYRSQTRHVRITSVPIESAHH